MTLHEYEQEAERGNKLQYVETMHTEMIYPEYGIDISRRIARVKAMRKED